MKKLLALLLLLGNVVLAQQTAGTTTTLDPTQIYSTGNIVQPTVAGTNQTPWVNGVYQDQLTCWAWGNPGYCGPNAIVRPGNLINFSFGMTDLYQVQSIASVLPNSGMGLRVNGYNFGFMAKNGNGWDDGRQDYLTAYVAFYGTDGKVKDYTGYNLNSKFDWTQFNYTKDFVSPYPAKDLSSVQYGFVGMDNNFWAGPYGPEIYNVSFSLKYSVDPCATNPLYSPTCPGYMDALAKLAPAPTTTTTDPITTTSTSPTTTTTIVTDPVASTVNVTSTTTVGQPSVVAPVVSAPTPTTTSSTSTATANPTTTASSQTTKESSGGSSNTSLALSIISKNSERDAAGSAVAQSAVSQAQAAANQAQQEAQSIASSAVANSLSANIISSNGQQSTGNGIRVNNNNNSSNFTLQSGLSTVAISGGLQTNTNLLGPQQNNNSTGVNVFSIQQSNTTNTGQQVINNTLTTFALPLLQPQQPAISQPIAVIQNEQQVQQQTILQNSGSNSQAFDSYAMLTPNFLTDKSNPLTDIIEGKQSVPQNNTTTTSGPVVNKNAQDNDVAGGVDINKMALAPTGYGDYLNFTLRDAAFYAPKEVYRNQRNVDNARALRQLTNDSKHQQMVEQQYRR